MTILQIHALKQAKFLKSQCFVAEKFAQLLPTFAYLAVRGFLIYFSDHT